MSILVWIIPAMILFVIVWWKFIFWLHTVFKPAAIRWLTEKLK